jgi:predicted DNA binding protein
LLSDELGLLINRLEPRTPVLEAVLKCPQPHKWIQLVTEGYSANVEILDSKMPSEGITQHLFDIQAKGSQTEELLEAIKKDKDVTEVEAVKSKGGHIYGSASSRRCTVCKTVAQSKCFLASVAISSKEGARWTVLGSGESFSGLLKSLEKEGVPYEVMEKRNLEDSDLLTSRQEQILSIAFQMGYFDFPKRAGLKEVAAQTGIKTSTLAEIVRRGQKKILGEYLTKRSLLHGNRD